MKYLHGQFLSNNNTLYEVRIKNSSAVSGEMIIGGDNVKFSSDPVHITSNCENLFTHIIKKSATITLYSKVMLTDYIFAANQNDVEVEIYEGNNLIFKGYVEPNIYSMPYAHEWDEISINCLDYLSVMQYSKPTDNSIYETVKANASIKPLYQIITNLIPNRQIVFDGSRTVANSGGYNIFHCISVSELVFLGENEDDVMTNEEILFEILQYLNLHIIQEGNTFYIFDFNSRHKNSIRWGDLIDNTLFKNQTVNTITLTKNDYSSDGTNITVDDVFNQIQVKADIEKMETVIESPLEKDKMISQFNNYQKYMTEIYSELNELPTVLDFDNEGWVNWKQLMNNQNISSSKKAWIRDWFFRVKENPNWKFNYNGNDLYQYLYEDVNGEKINQWKFPKFLRDHRFASCLMAIGKGKKKQPKELDGNVDLQDYLVISVNGETKNISSALTEFSNDCQAQNPIIEYQGNTNGVYSPNDANTTNYLVFSGNFTLVPILQNSGYDNDDKSPYQKSNNTFTQTLAKINSSTAADWVNVFLYGVVPYGAEKYAYLCNKYWKQTHTIKDEAYVDTSNYNNFFYPLTDLQNVQETGITYNYSNIQGVEDNIDEVPVLECQLKIGDKFCVEEFETVAGGTKKSVYHWYTYSQCPTVDGTKKTTFSLGFNPSIGDVIIGKEYPIATNFDYTFNIGAKDGTAIPITRQDNLQGKVEFKILGVINSTWDSLLTRKKTFWEYIIPTDTTESILNLTSSILIKDFECKIYSDNNGYATNSDNDLIYISDENTEYIKVKDDIEMKINTALSSEEAYQYKVENTVNLSSAIDTNTGYALTSLTDAVENETAKGEELYCNWFYNEYSTPKIILETDLKDSVNIDLFNKYNIGFMNKNFGIVETSRDLKENQTHIKFREI